MNLIVFRSNTKIGLLDMASNEPFYGFTYDSAYLTTSEAQPLSLSLPLTESRFPGKQAQPYFEGLLPEGAARNAIAQKLGISRTSSVKLLRALGRDCAGDISIIEEENNNVEFEHTFNKHKYIPLDNIKKIAESPRTEIVRLQEETRLSLAGGQEKIALLHPNNKSLETEWYIPVSGSPSTHIIKPGLLETLYPSITLNEYLCLRAAMECGIKTVQADILFPSNPILVIRRYDRIVSSNKDNKLPSVHRIHQEDFCQASGIKSDMKYEYDGGPGYKQIRSILLKNSKNPLEDITMLVKWAIFNYLIGNCDAHAKNISLLHNANGTVSLAPAYDLICTSIYNGHFGEKLSRSMGMKIGLHENIDKIDTNDFTLFAQDVHFRPNQIMLIGEELAKMLPSAFKKASHSAESSGFTDAGSLANRIINDSKGRAKVLVCDRGRFSVTSD